MAPTEPVANLKLVDAIVPQLTAGSYTLTVTQTLQVETETDPIEDFTASKTFSVRGPRFSLAPDEIYSRYPASGHRGAFHLTLPHVVFRRKALPWERPIDPDRRPDDKATEPEPWVALLVFAEDELRDAPFVACSWQDVVEPTGAPGRPDPRGPSIELDLWELGDSGRCTILDIQLGLFRKVAPRRDELRYLAHARLVAPHDKEDVYGVGDGWFSVVLANRIPADKTRSVAVLVSLEGHGDLISRAQDPQRDAKTTVRLVVLDHWAFVSEDQTFEQRIENLHRDKNKKDRDPWLRASVGPKVEGIVGEAIALGYVPMPHNLRNGGRTVSWYRGPLVPVLLQSDSRSRIFGNADEALQFDRNTGMIDASYAAAWQLGRLLALQAPEFARSLYQYDSGCTSIQLMTRTEEAFQFLFGPARSEQTPLQRATEMQQDDLLIALALEGTGLDQTDAAHTLFDEIDTENVREEASRRPTAPAAVTSFLARLSLLHGVPFNYLVADEKLLPPESLKFFHIDPQWINTLVGGALSVGGSETRRLLVNKTQAGTYFTDEIAEEARQLRARQRRPDAAGSPLGAASGSSFSGFLLRSRILEAWPGLEVRALRSDPRAGQDEVARLLRLDRVAPDILFGLVDGPPPELEITQPPEGLHFMVKDDEPFRIEGEDKEKNKEPIKKARVLDVSACANGASSDSGRVSSATFARNRIARPLRFVFRVDG